MSKFYPNVLDKNQKFMLPQLDFLNKYRFYLAGGTALSLQIGHRTSVDFDFFTPKHFDSTILYNKLEEKFRENIKKISEEKDTLFININNVDISFFWYKYPLVSETTTFEGISLASLKDISAMKLLAITHRPVKRDYIDICFLLRSFELRKIFSFAEQKYPNFNDYLALRALTYFDDIKESETKRPIKILKDSFSWDKARKTIFEEVKKFQLSMFKK